MKKIAGLLLAVSFFIGFVSSCSAPQEEQSALINGAQKSTKTITSSNVTKLAEIGIIGKGKIEEVIWSPDGTLIAVNSTLGVFLFDSSTLQEKKFYSKDSYSMETIAFSPDNKYLAGIRGESIDVWDINSDKLLFSTNREMEVGDSFFINAIAYSPNGELLAVTGFNNTVKIIDAHTGEELLILKENENDFYCMEFSPDGETIATGFYSNIVKIWNVRSGDLLTTFTAPTNYFYSLSYSPDGKILIGGSDSSIFIWEVESESLVQEIRTYLNDDNSVAISPDGQTITTGSGFAGITLLSINTGETIQTLRGHRSGVISVDFSPDGQMVVSGAKDGTVRLWDLNTGLEKQRVSGFIDWASELAYSPDGEMIAVGNDSNIIQLWSTKSNTEITSLSYNEGIPPEQQDILTDITWDSVPVDNLLFSPDGHYLVSGGNKILIAWDLVNNYQHQFFCEDSYTDSCSIESLAFSPDSTKLASGHKTGRITIWDVASGSILLQFNDNLEYGYQNYINSIAYSPDGTTLVTGNDEGKVQLWNVSTGEEISTLVTLEDKIQRVSFLEDGKTLLTNCQNGLVQFWNSENGIEIRHFTANGMISISPNEQIVVFPYYSSINIYNIKGENIIKLDNLTTDMDSQIAFSPDGRFLISVGQYGIIRIFGIK